MPQKSKKSLQQKFHQENEHLGRPPCKILKTILKRNKGGTQTNGPKDKDIDEDAQDRPRNDVGRLYVSRKE